MRIALLGLVLLACGHAPAPTTPPAPEVQLASTGMLWALGAPAGCTDLARREGGTCTVENPWVRVKIEGPLAGGTIIVRDDPRKWGPKSWTAKGWDPQQSCRRTWVQNRETSPNPAVNDPCPSH